MTPKKLVTIIATLIVVCSAMVIGMYIARVGLNKIVPQGIRFSLTCLLCFSLIRGWNPGRWITVVLMGLAGIGSVIGGVGLMTRSPSGIFLFALGVVYLGCVAGLFTPTAKAHFVSNHQAQPSAAPNGGPTAPVDNPNAPGGPPSVS